MTLTCVIVDDEYLAIKVLEDYVARNENLQMIKAFRKPQEALAFLQSNPVDLLFLDIQMPDLDGFGLLSKLENPLMVVFTTARPDYAVKAYELKVLDYLLKPISIFRFEQAAQKAIEYAGYITLSNTHKDDLLDYLMINSDFHVHKVWLKDIIYIEGLGEYVRIHCLSGKKYITLLALKSLEAQFEGLALIRVHKSFIVNLDHIRSFSHSEILVTNGKQIPIGRSYRKGVLCKLYQ
ncbi:MAG: two component transcriptional regulator, LytTR family [Bacteroidetes bacterium]|jgi:DNA-binding LytR/AlgR family response regulator|nr:two component transcriptional regulator, LytTR family [Bacteroidota bacterium]